MLTGEGHAYSLMEKNKCLEDSCRLDFCACGAL